MTLYKGTYSTQQHTIFGQLWDCQLFCRPVWLPISISIIEDSWQAEFNCSEVKAQNDSIRQKQNVDANCFTNYCMKIDGTRH